MTTVSSAVSATRMDGGETSIEAALLDELKGALRGNLLMPGNAAYDAARRVLNPSIDKHPALVVQPRVPADVSTAVNFAREKELLLAVKCGGHSFSGKSTCNGGMQIDLSLLRGARVDRERKRAYVAGGSLLGDLDAETCAHGLVTTAGTVSHTGVGGLALGGGFGRVGRKYGLTLDNIKAVDIVAADGVMRRASADENPELFWGIRGGGGNFGIVTMFDFGLHEMDRTVIAGDVVFPFARAKDIFNFYAEYSQEAPDELQLDLVMVLPPGGQPGVVVLQPVWCGAHKDAEQALAPISKLGEPIANSIGPKDYVELQKSADDTDPRHGGMYIKGGFVSDITGAQIDAIVDGFEAHPDRATIFFYQQSGGAITRVPQDATAFSSRDAINGPAAVVSWNPGADRDLHVGWIKEYWATIEPHTRGFYTNGADFETQQAIDRNYRDNHSRLVALKDQYDPGNLFRLNTNIKPSGSASRA